MKPYDHFRDDLDRSFRHYPYVVVANRTMIEYPFDERMEKTFTKVGENCMGQRYTDQIVGWGMSHIPGSDETFYLFHDGRNRDIFVRENSAAIITTQPFGPDKCPDCGGPAPVVRFVEKPPKWWEFWR